ncbi:MAG: lysophospholipid acyltransferase family protein [Chlorobi bacterium]|nr:lysophospholipid acyltransferase family protein [Chlorobiota bacterium]
MLPAKKNRLVKSLFTLYHKSLLRKYFYQIHLAGEENIAKINNSLPVVIYANHSNWWDGFIAYLLSSRRLNADDYIMMDLEQMRKYPFFKYLGAFSVNRGDAKDAIKTIEYAAELLNKTNRYLWIFPQGLMQVQDRRPIKFFSGLVKIAVRLEGVNLLPVAIRYEFLLEQRPEVFIKIAEPDIVHNITNIKELTTHLENKLISSLYELRNKIIGQKLDEFKVIFKGKDSRNKTIDKLYGK